MNKLKKCINETKKEAGQPYSEKLLGKEPTDKEKGQLIDMITDSVAEKLRSRICRRCSDTNIDNNGDYCAKCKPIIDKEIQFNVLKQIKATEINIINIQREIDFKAAQVASTGDDTPSEIIETRTIKRTDTGEPVIIDGFKSGLKPRFLLENEIDDLRGRKELFEKQLEHLKKEVKNVTAEDRD